MLTVKVVDNKITLVESDLPKCDEDEILVRMHSCGICGSDLEKVYGNYGMKSSRVGHEPAGAVIKVGKNIKKFQEGDRVFVHHHVSCYSCRYCIQGAALIEPFACCIRGLNKISIKHGDNVAILGAGPTGIMHTLLAKTWGANNIVVSDINQFRLKFVEKYGVITVNSNQENLDSIIKENTGNIGTDITILATGSIKAFETSLKITRRGGKILLFGVPSVGSKFELDLNSMYSNEQIIIPSYGASEIETNQALSLISDKSIDLLPLVTHRFQIRESSDAFKCAHDAFDAMKVLIVTS